jgi:hypothetical protein
MVASITSLRSSPEEINTSIKNVFGVQIYHAVLVGVFISASVSVSVCLSVCLSICVRLCAWLGRYTLWDVFVHVYASRNLRMLHSLVWQLNQRRFRQNNYTHWLLNYQRTSWGFELHGCVFAAEGLHFILNLIELLGRFLSDEWEINDQWS